MTTTDKSSGIRVKRVPREETATTTTTSAPAPAVASPLGRVTGGAVPTASEPEYATPPLRSASRETRPFYLTSEFLLTSALMLGLLFAGYLRDDTLNTWRTWLLVTVIGAAYVLSRGIAKAGSTDRH